MITWILPHDKFSRAMRVVCFCVADGSLLVGFKSEWASVKEHRLYVGSVGKEWTTSGGELVNYNPMWIKTVSLSGQVAHIDWEVQYKTLRQAVGVEFPGKLLSDCRRSFIFIAELKVCLINEKRV